MARLCDHSASFGQVWWLDSVIIALSASFGQVWWLDSVTIALRLDKSGG